jgi:hypothetical protein
VDLTVQNILICFNFSVYKWARQKFAAGDEGDKVELSQVVATSLMNNSAQRERQDSGTESFAD